MTPEQEREILLAHAATQKVSRWVAFFGYRPDQCDGDLVSDVDGAGLMVVQTAELSSFIGPVAVWIRPGSDPQLVFKILERIAQKFPESDLYFAHTGDKPC